MTERTDADSAESSTTHEVPAMLPFGLEADDDVLQRCWDVISESLEDSLDDFCNAVLKSELGAVLADVDCDAFKDLHRRHWRRVFLGECDQDYLKQVRRMLGTHRRLGLSSTYLIASYLNMLRRFHGIVFEKVGDLREGETLARAIDTIVAVDIVRSMAAYHGTEALD